MGQELELKFELDGTLKRRVSSWLVPQGAKATSARRMLETTYYDTPALSLRKDGISLRIRKSRDGYVQTIKKRDGVAAGLFERQEWDSAVEGTQPDLSQAQKTGFRTFRQKRLRKLLSPIFKVSTRRATYTVANGGALFELAVDDAKLLSGKRRSSFCELEIELLKGKPDDLFRFARALNQTIPLRIATGTKSDRGYALLQPSKEIIHRAGPIRLVPTMTSESAFQAIARNCLHHFLANEAATVDGNVEALHQMRVALRRLRAAISIFSEMVLDHQATMLKREFAWIMGELGRKRDLDVLLSETLKFLPKADDKTSLVALRRNFQKQRKLVHGQLRAAVCSQRFRNMVLEAAAWIECGPWTRKRGVLAKARREHAIIGYSAGELGRRFNKFSKSVIDLKEVDPVARHRLRIRAKKLRYAVEFFGSLFEDEKNAHRHAAMLSALKNLQDGLGALNDLTTHEKLISELVQVQRGAAKKISKQLMNRWFDESAEESRDRLLDEANAARHKILESKPFWK